MISPSPPRKTSIKKHFFLLQNQTACFCHPRNCRSHCLPFAFPTIPPTTRRKRFLEHFRATKGAIALQSVYRRYLAVRERRRRARVVHLALGAGLRALDKAVGELEAKASASQAGDQVRFSRRRVQKFLWGQLCSFGMGRTVLCRFEAIVTRGKSTSSVLYNPSTIIGECSSPAGASLRILVQFRRRRVGTIEGAGCTPSIIYGT